MKGLKKAVLVAAALFAAGGASAQTYLKLNALYLLAGVINPQVEMTVSPHSSVVVDITYSPWQSIKGRHLHFGMLNAEYRYFFRQATQGWYVSANAGLNIFDISKPQFFTNGKVFSLRSDYSKGCGVMVGAGFGYEHHFCKRWVVDAYFAFDWYHSWYNGYSAEGELNANPNPQWNARYPDPFNKSAEWLPAKIGVSIGYCIVNPDRGKRGGKANDM